MQQSGMVVDSQICSDPIFILNQLGTNVPKLKNNLHYIDLILWVIAHIFFELEVIQ